MPNIINELVKNYFGSDDQTQKQKYKNDLNFYFESWSNRDILHDQDLDTQVKIFEDLNLNINSFCFLSTEVQNYIISNYEKYKDVLNQRFKTRHNFFFNSPLDIKKLASKYFDIGFDEESENRTEIIRSSELNKIYEKLLYNNLTQKISAGFYHTKTAYVALNMYKHKKDRFKEDGWEDLKRQCEKDKGITINYKNDPEPVFSYLKEKYDVEPSVIRFLCRTIPFFYGCQDNIFSFNDLILSGKPIGIQNVTGSHIQPLKNSREIRKQFAKNWLEVTLIDSFFYYEPETTEKYSEPGDIDYAIYFFNMFLVDNNPESKQELSSQLEKKLNQIFEHVPVKYRPYKIMQACDLLIQEFSYYFIDNYDQNKNLDYNKWVFDKLDDFGKKFLAINKDKIELADENNKLLNIIKQKNTQIDNVKNKLIKPLERKNKFGIISGAAQIFFGMASFILAMVTLTQTTNLLCLAIIALSVLLILKGTIDITISARSKENIKKSFDVRLN